MRTMQEKVLTEIEKIAQNSEFEAVVSYGASNTGNLHIMDGFDNILIIKFNFQTSYCSFTVFNKREIELVNLTKGYLEYIKNAELKKFLSSIETFVREYEMGKMEAK